jgi:hypothetical protein
VLVSELRTAFGLVPAIIVTCPPTTRLGMLTHRKWSVRLHTDVSTVMPWSYTAATPMAAGLLHPIERVQARSVVRQECL